MSLAEQHQVRSSVVGLAGQDNDRMIPEFMDFVESALRMEDAIFRLTRERSILFLTDVGPEEAEGIVGRLLDSFAERFPARKPPSVELGLCEIEPTSPPPAMRDVLLQVFPAQT